MKNIATIISILFLQSMFSLNAQTTDAQIIFGKYKSEIDTKLKKGELIINTGKFFLETPYVANTLEINDNEQLVVNLLGLDCTTFVENTFALVNTACSPAFSFANYGNNLTKIRYREGKINHYPSRLHYFADWITDNENKGLIKDITKKIGGDSIHFHVGYMSKNPDKYKALRLHPEFIPTIAQQENAINARTYYYIPKDKIASVSGKIKQGDIIAITTGIKGLDISHVGFAIQQDKQLHFMHASSTLKKVVVSEKTLAEYVNSVKSNTGIIVLRIQ